LLNPPSNLKETTMSRPKSGFAPSLAVLLAAGLAACSPQQQQSRPAAMSGQGAAGSQSLQGQAASGGMQGHSGHTMSGGSMQGHSMAGMDHQSMMAHCAQMRQTVRQGGRLSPDMQQMMAHCDQMDRSMGASRPR
jgi:hypothetical protein